MAMAFPVGTLRHEKLRDVHTPHWLGELEAAVCSEDEVASEIAIHKGDASAHHGKTSALPELTDWPSGHDITTRHALGTVVPHDALASLTEKAFSSLTGRWALSQAHRGTDGKIMVFKGPGADPAEEDKLSSKVKIEERDMAAPSGDASYTGYGFKPSCLITHACIIYDRACWGFSDSAKDGFSIQPDPNLSWGWGAALISFTDIYALAGQSAIVKSYDGDGFTLTWTKTGSPSGTIKFPILALR